MEIRSAQFLRRKQISISAWILVQYGYNHNYPSEGAKTGIELILFVVSISQNTNSLLTPVRFSGCWTILVVGSYLLLFLHPILSRTPVASIGVQGVWICLTWILWIVATAYLNAVLPFVTIYSQCSLVYCGQLKALFGKFHALHFRNELTNEAPSHFRCTNVRKTLTSVCFTRPGVLIFFISVFFAFAMFVIMWLAWQRIHGK